MEKDLGHIKDVLGLTPELIKEMNEEVIEDKIREMLKPKFDELRVVIQEEIEKYLGSREEPEESFDKVSENQAIRALGLVERYLRENPHVMLLCRWENGSLTRKLWFDDGGI